MPEIKTVAYLHNSILVAASSVKSRVLLKRHMQLCCTSDAEHVICKTELHVLFRRIASFVRHCLLFLLYRQAKEQRLITRSIFRQTYRKQNAQ